MVIGFSNAHVIIPGKGRETCNKRRMIPMARRSRRRPVVPGAGQGLDQLKAEVMRREGYVTNPARPDMVKYEVARTLGIPLRPEGNQNLTTEQAGKIGGQIGGSMVREMIRMAQEQLAKRR
jgi:small acid-soluble spore protein D (minor alpha/beta-type SASP)